MTHSSSLGTFALALVLGLCVTGCSESSNKNGGTGGGDASVGGSQSTGGDASATGGSAGARSTGGSAGAAGSPASGGSAGAAGGVAGGAGGAAGATSLGGSAGAGGAGGALPANRAYFGAPPTMPHMPYGCTQNCLTCHESGPGPITPHPERKLCRQCHLPQQDVPLFVPNTFQP